MKLSGKNLPDFIIVGGMKAGTTTLAKYLFAHPNIYMPEEEIHYFDSVPKDEININDYSKFFNKVNDQQIIGEKTPTYCYIPEIPSKIHKILPEVKIVWMLRDPVARAYSNYWHAVKSGVERLSFTKAVLQEKERIIIDPFKGYLNRSIYYNQIINYLKFYRMDKMLFILQDDLKDKKKDTLIRICNFLNIDYFSEWDNYTIQSNITRIPRSRTLQYIGKKWFDGSKIFSLIWRLNHLGNNSYPPLKKEEEKNLKNFFKPFNQKLADLINRDLNHWDI